MEKKTTIFIADDHPVFRKGLIDIIKEEKSFELIGESSDGENAFETIMRSSPDIAILDINMPKLSGFEVVKLMKKNDVKTKIIFLTMHKEDEILNKALELEVTGYILKECAVDDIIECINYVNEGQTYISPAISNIILKHNKLKSAYKSSFEKLTPMEKKILYFIADGNTSQEIADKLFISIRTVENHRENICKKLELHGVNSLIKFAFDHKHLF